MESMLSSSVGPMRWMVLVEGREHIVDVIWPGFSNSIAVDGRVVQSWWWPGNNLRVVRKFELHGIPCRLVRQRSGLVSYTFELEVGSANALVRRIPA